MNGHSGEEETLLYGARCGWCGAYEGTVDPDEPCATDSTTGEYVGPHQFGIYEPIGRAALRSGADRGRDVRDQVGPELAIFGEHCPTCGAPVRVGIERRGHESLRADLDFPARSR